MRILLSTMMLAALSLLAALAVCGAADIAASTSIAPPSPQPLTLNDRPIIAGNHTSLDGYWTLSSPSHSLGNVGRVPGDLISDLVAAGLLPEPLYENNFLVNASLWNDQTWTYTRQVALSAQQVQRLRSGEGGDVWLVFDGIKLGANILWNGALMTVSIHQFLRLELSLQSLVRDVGLEVREGDNELSVVFDPDIDEYGQFMQCSGGWDWAPVSQSQTKHSKLGVYTRGIWKSVYLLDVDWLAITDMTAHVTYTGSFPTTPLEPGNHEPFSVWVSLLLYAPQAVAVDLAFMGDWRNATTEQRHVTLTAGNTTVTWQLTVSAEQIDLWWPNGRGAQPLYNFTATATRSDGTDPPLQTSRRIGFRVFHIVTGNDTDPAWVEQHATDNGSGRQGLRYRVNGEPIFARGANMIPIDMLEGRYRADSYQRIVLSAADAGMNLVRIWAGGIWLNEVFYDTADEAGVMIYHDQINRQQLNGRPEEFPAYRHQLRRLSSHPAIVAWDGCNECFPWLGGGIVPELMTLVSQIDRSRPIWPACPAEGWDSGVNKLTGLPNGEPLVKHDIPLPWGPWDTHGPYQHGDGFPAVNGSPRSLNLFDPMTPPHFDATTPIGMYYNHTFTSEFGAVHWSSFESVSATFHPSHWSLHGGSPPDNCTDTFGGNQCNGTNVIAQRNYPCDSIVLTYFGGSQSQLDEVGEAAFKQQLFKCLVGSALIVKGYIEQHRATNTFGLMIWQLNEVWPTGGWGSLEYANGEFPGQVVGGRWKPTHYWLLHHLYNDVIVSCGLPMDAQDGDLLCYVKLDAYQPAAVKYTVVVQQWQLADGSVRSMGLSITLLPGPGSIKWFTLDSSWATNSSMLNLEVHTTTRPSEVATTNFFLSAPPAQLALTAGTLDVSLIILDAPNADEATIVVRKGSGAVALFFTLTTLAAGRFSHNCFHLLAGETNVTFVPFGPLNRTLLTQSLRWEHANLYWQAVQSEQSSQRIEAVME